VVVTRYIEVPEVYVPADGDGPVVFLFDFERVLAGQLPPDCTSPLLSTFFQPSLGWVEFCK